MNILLNLVKITILFMCLILMLGFWFIAGFIGYKIYEKIWLESLSDEQRIERMLEELHGNKNN